MAEPTDRQRERERERRRENERKDLEVEENHGERPLEGLSRAHTTWTEEQDESQASVHEGDEAASRARSAAHVPPRPAPGERGGER